MSQAAPGFTKHPEYSVDIEPSKAHIRVLDGTTVIADSRRALAVTESRHHPVWYLPMADVEQTLLSKTEHSTYCPFKGHASYWSITSANNLDNSVWGYEDPFTECLGLKDHVAFYTDRVTLEIDGAAMGSQGPGWTER